MTISHKITLDLGIMPRSNALLRTIPEWVNATERKLDEETLRSNAACARDFARWADARGVTRPGTVTSAITEEWWHQQDDLPDYSPYRRIRYMEALRGWFRWLMEAKRVFHNPFMEVVLPPERKPDEMPPMEPEPQDDVIEYLAGMDRYAPLRDRAILCIQACTDLKAREVSELEIGHLDRNNWVFKTLRGDKDLDSRAQGALLEWLEARHEEITAWGVETPFIFLRGRRGTREPLGRISPRAVSRTSFTWRQKMET